MWQRPDAARLAELLMRYQANVDTLAEWAHPSWTVEFAQLCPASLVPPRELVREGSRHIWGGGAAHAPSLDAFASQAHGIAVLPPADLMRVMCARALMFYRTAVRRCVDKPRRQTLRQWASSAALAQVSALKGDTPVDIDDDPAARTALALGWDGYCLMRVSGVWSDPALMRLMRFAFARDALEPTWLSGVANLPGERDHSALLVSRLTDYFPDLSWLSGYEAATLPLAESA